MKIKTLQELCSQIIDCPHATPVWKTNGVPVIRNYNLIDGILDTSNLSYVDEKTYQSRIKRGIPEAGDIVFSREAPVGNVAMIPNGFKGCLGQRLVLLKVDTSICDRDYLLHVLLSDFAKKQYKRVEKTGSIVSNFNIGDLSELKIPCPNIEEQHKIGSILKHIDNKIRCNQSLAHTLESMAKTLYDYYFVQFDFPDENGRPYKTSGGKMTYNAKLGRKIPEGWEVIPLRVIATVIQGNSPVGSTLNENGNGIVFYQGKTDFGFRYPTERIYTTDPYRYAEPQDTLLSVRAPVGDVNMVEEKCCIGRGLAAIHSDMPSLIYYSLMKLKPFFERYGMGGTTFSSIMKEDIQNVLICKPPDELCQKFEKKIEKFDSEILNKVRENRKLQHLRDFLLPMLMNGQVTFH